MEFVRLEFRTEDDGLYVFNRSRDSADLNGFVAFVMAAYNCTSAACPELSLSWTKEPNGTIQRKEN